MNPKQLIYHSQARFKLWTWTELERLTGQNKDEIKLNLDQNEIQDPLAVLTYNHKNYNPEYIATLEQNYTQPDLFQIKIDQFGLSNAITQRKHQPYYYHLTQNQDWYWKQKWLAKNKSLFLLIPGVKNIYLACSVASQISHDQSDVDLLIQVDSNCVWLTKIYFAVISKLLKYYEFNFILGLYFWLTGDKTELEKMKNEALHSKIKIDFGMVFEKWSQVESNYSDKERHYSIWNNLDIQKELNYFQPPITQIVYYALIPIYYLLTPLFFLIGLIHFKWHQNHNQNNPNMLVKWSIYSQYNKIY
jgi:hypothetical protein